MHCSCARFATDMEACCWEHEAKADASDCLVPAFCKMDTFEVRTSQVAKKVNFKLRIHGNQGVAVELWCSSESDICFGFSFVTDWGGSHAIDADGIIKKSFLKSILCERSETFTTMIQLKNVQVLHRNYLTTERQKEKAWQKTLRKVSFLLQTEIQPQLRIIGQICL